MSEPQSRVEKAFDGLVARALFRISTGALITVLLWFAQDSRAKQDETNKELGRLRVDFAVLSADVRGNTLASTEARRTLSNRLDSAEARIQFIERLSRR